MAAQAAHLVDAVLPAVPVRQWVLSLPWRLRYRLAWDHRLCRAVLAVHVRAVLAFYRRHARRHGVADGRGGTVTVIQRFGGGLNLNVHFHPLALDGVFAAPAGGEVEFHAAAPPSDAEVARVLATIHRRVGRLLRRRGLLDAAGIRGGRAGVSALRGADAAAGHDRGRGRGPAHPRAPGGTDGRAGATPGPPPDGEPELFG